MTPALLGPLISLAAMLPIAALAWWVIRRNARGRLAAVTPLDGGGVAIPVRELVWRGGTLLGAMTRNGISPAFAVRTDGLHFKVLREAHWPYRHISRVDAGRILFGYQVRFAGDGELYVSVATVETARAILKALPPGAPLTKAASALRDG